MKTTENNEMDLLLRSLGRKASARSGNPNSLQSGAASGAHLDADELNCYAEGVVSTTERARYMKHLTDCDSCRRIVADLVPAAGASRRYPVVEEKTGWSLRQSLAALFAPSVLRFALPALALTAIIGISIVALRRPQQTEFIAQNETPTVPAVSGNEGQKAPTDNISQSAASPEQRQQAPADARGKELFQSPKPAAAAPKVSQSDKPTSADRTATGLVKPGESVAVAKSEPTFAEEPTAAAAPPPPPRAGLEDASKVGEGRNAQAEAEAQKRRRDYDYSQRREQNEMARSSSAKGGPSRNDSQNVGGLSSVMSRSNKDEKAQGNAAESRRVSGRVFYRQGNAWIDADYASGRATVKVSRGSEQYRALIADEPGIRAIAEQLGGEVIVVWKGTAYRIR
jgi:hypothetical protein